MAGSDFIKTSTGKEPTNATLPVSLAMLRALREYMQLTGYKVGFKPAGGISKAKQVVQYQCMMKDELGDGECMYAQKIAKSITLTFFWLVLW